MLSINLLPVEMWPPWNKGTTKYCNSSIARMSEAKVGKPRSKEIREKLSKAAKEYYKSKGMSSDPKTYAHKISATLMGHTISEETKRKISETLKRRIKENGKPFVDYRDPAYRQRISMSQLGKIVSESTKEKIRLARSKQQLPTMNTKIECALKDILDELGVTYKRNCTIIGLTPTLGWYHQFDVVLYDYKLVIEADGCYWHACKTCYTDKPIKHPKGSAEEIRSKDQKINDAVVLFGWRILRIPEHLFKCLDDVRVLVANVLKA